MSRLPASVTEVIVIHGYHGGQALGNMVRQRLKHPRIRAKILCLNPGETRLLLSPRRVPIPNKPQVNLPPATAYWKAPGG